MKVASNYVGLTVSDLDRSTAFYRSLGGELIMQDTMSGPGLDRGLAEPGVELHLSMLRFGSLVVELLEYRRRPSEPYGLRNASVRASHIAFTVEDVHEVHRTLAAQRIEFLSEPIPLSPGPFEGGWFIYAKDPDGVAVEFCQPGPGFAAV